MSAVPKPNRLVNEKSPYLRQHAYNPVDWHPWAEEAFERARREDKPVFLSIGYSACHWCHVMEQESFEDEDVARILNEAFVAVKVDREERPDIDNASMAVCRMLTGGGGWPLTIILTPDKKPIFAGTYFPKQTRYSRIGLLELIPRLQSLWKNNRAGALVSGDKIQSALEEISRASAPGDVPPDIASQAFDRLSAEYDSEQGGFGIAPKFPVPHNIMFLLRYAARTGSRDALDMAVTTLRAMRQGGIWDHLGFGFHRYSTDRVWLVPHFEKMLYDQALLTLAYLEAFQATAEPDFRRTGEHIAAYVQRDMTSPEGGFYAAEDADSEGQEGKFYVWSEDEVRGALTAEEADLAAMVFNIDAEGNFEGMSGESAGRNILHLTADLDKIAAELQVPEDDFRLRVESIRAKLLAARRERVPPLKDTKILTDWNGLMIAALAKVGQLPDEARFAQAAEKAADLILTKMRQPDGRLRHRLMDGEAGIPGFLDDYAFLTWGLIELYETTFAARYLRAAIELTDSVLARFWDEKQGGFFFTADDATELPPRRMESLDGALPSGNSVMVMNLARLARMTGRMDFEEKAQAAGRAFAPDICRSPASFTGMICGLDFASGPGTEVVIVGNPEASDTRNLVQAVRKGFFPNKVVLLRPEGESPEIAELAPYTAAMTGLGGRAAAYVCSGFRCGLPVTDPQALIDLLRAT
jgi:uncharacterized protein YyaL (SSP411 family)